MQYSIRYSKASILSSGMHMKILEGISCFSKNSSTIQLFFPLHLLYYHKISTYRWNYSGAYIGIKNFNLQIFFPFTDTEKKNLSHVRVVTHMKIVSSKMKLGKKHLGASFQFFNLLISFLLRPSK